MRRTLLILGPALLVVQQLHWASLAAGALPALMTLLLLGALGYAAFAAGLSRARSGWMAAGLALVALTELAFVAAPGAFVPSLPIAARLMECILVAGLGWMAWASWRGGSVRPGAWLALGYFAGAAARDLLAAEAFLLTGYALGVAGFGALLAAQTEPPRAQEAHAGALP